MKGLEYLGAFRIFFESLFTPQTHPAFKEQIWQRMSQTPRHVMASLLAEMLAWSGEATRRLNINYAAKLPVQWGPPQN